MPRPQRFEHCVSGLSARPRRLTTRYNSLRGFAVQLLMAASFNTLIDFIAPTPESRKCGSTTTSTAAYLHSPGCSSGRWQAIARSGTSPMKPWRTPSNSLWPAGTDTGMINSYL